MRSDGFFCSFIREKSRSWKKDHGANHKKSNSEFSGRKVVKFFNSTKRKILFFWVFWQQDEFFLVSIEPANSQKSDSTDLAEAPDKTRTQRTDHGESDATENEPKYRSSIRSGFFLTKDTRHHGAVTRDPIESHRRKNPAPSEDWSGTRFS